jgi:hypothetical protein
MPAIVYHVARDAATAVAATSLAVDGGERVLRWFTLCLAAKRAPRREVAGVDCTKNNVLRGNLALGRG